MKNIYYLMKKKLLLIASFLVIASYGLYSQTPTYIQISGITTPSAANGVYEKQPGTYGNLGYEYWKHQSAEYYLYEDNYGGTEYWNIDNNLNDDDDIYFYSDGANRSASNPLLVGLGNWVPSMGSGLNTLLEEYTPGPTVSFTSASQSSAGESATMTITAQLSATSASDVTVPFSVNGSSTATGGGTDYSITASPIIIIAGNTSDTITITIVSDALDENNETVVVDMGTPTNATQGATTSHTATITDDDASPTVTFTSASQSSVNETGTMTITAQLSAVSGRNVTVPFTVNGASTATGGGTDYSITASPITITAGNMTNTITITIASDVMDENNETVIVDMGTPTNATQGATTSHTATITDDDASPTVTFTATSQSSANETGTMTITAQLSAVSGRDVSVPFTVNGSSTATGGGTDYSITASPITITAGNTTNTITITIASDVMDENNETVIVDMGAPTNATQGATTSHTATITDDDASPTVTFTTSSQSSANETGTLAITTQLSAVSGRDVTIPFTVNGSSTATGGGTDYSITASPITITTGNTTNTITITIATDAMDENNETVVVDMGTPTNASQGATTSHTATITDDDTSPTVTFTTASQSSANETGTMVITAQLSAVSGRNVTVPFSVNGSSTATGSGTDYSITASPIIIIAGNTTDTITITIASDVMDENNETVIVDMGTPTNATQGATTSHTATITDDDASPTVTFTAASQSSANETGTMTITAQLSAVSGRDVSVPFTVNGSGTAAGGGTDYSITASPITITAGNMTNTITITIASDAMDENNETVIVDMGTPTNATQGATTSHTATITDDDETPVVTALQSFSVNENSTGGTVVGTVVATDTDAGTAFSGWAITVNANSDGDGNNAFAINASTGEITVTDAGDLDREADASLTIKVTVSDGTNTSAEEDVIINLTDVNDVDPVITASQVFHVTEQSANGTEVDTVLATDGDVSSTTFQNWNITAGNDDGCFTINASTGVITVADNTGLNLAVNESFTLTLTVSDGTNTSQTETVTIIVDGVNDDDPVITPSQSFSIDENSANSTVVGEVLATDPDYGTVFQGWAITEGNTNNAFAISASGEITVSTSSELDFESAIPFSLTIQVSDGVHIGEGVVTINMNNLNDNAPVITVATFTINENSANETVVGAVDASDADGDLNDLAYSITSGNTNDAFAINSTNGEIAVNKTEEIDYETNPVFNLTVNVSDGLHSDEADVTINLSDIIETGIEDKKAASIKVYPNPAANNANIYFNCPWLGPCTIEIVGLDGDKIYQREVNTHSEVNTIDLTGIKGGIYFIKVYNQQFMHTQKLIIQ